MGYSGWRFSCDRGTLERCAGALEIRAKEIGDRMMSGDLSDAEHMDAVQDMAWADGAAAALRAILADGDGIDPAEFVARVMSGIGA